MCLLEGGSEIVVLHAKSLILVLRLGKVTKQQDISWPGLHLINQVSPIERSGLIPSS